MKESFERFGESFAEMYISRGSGPPDAFLVNVLANVFNPGVIVSPGSGDVINFIVLSLNHQQTVWWRKLKYRTPQMLQCYIHLTITQSDT